MGSRSVLLRLCEFPVANVGYPGDQDRPKLSGIGWDSPGLTGITGTQWDSPTFRIMQSGSIPSNPTTDHRFSIPDPSINVDLFPEPCAPQRVDRFSPTRILRLLVGAEGVD